MDYDIIFIGGGLNYAGAVIAQKAGLGCLLIEKNLDHLGGACLHEGCIPSKHLLFHGHLLLNSKRPVFTGGPVSLDLNMLQDEKNEILQKTTAVIRNQIEKAGVSLTEGQGIIEAPNRVRCNDKVITGKNIVIGTGSSPFIPEGIGFDSNRIITSNEALNLRRLPKNIGIIGGGPVALEFASFFQANGSRVHIFIRRKRILPRSHPLIRENLTEILEAIGITFHPSSQVLSAKTSNEKVEIKTNKGDFEFDLLLVATGRKANTDVVNCPQIEINRAIVTDDRFETTLPNHFAIGDCNGKLMLAHAARAQVLHVVKNIAGAKKPPLRLERIPRFIETLPIPYAKVGYSRPELEDKNMPFEESIFKLSGITISRTFGATKGAIILYADKNGKLLGGEMLSPHAPDIISLIGQCLEAGLKASHLKQVVFPHPTISEAIGRCVMHLR